MDKDFVVNKDKTFVWITEMRDHIPVQISTTYKEGREL
jgi:hypothetical protein